MVQAVLTGSSFRWLCAGCNQMEALDLTEWLSRCGPHFSMLNQIDVCCCGAPRTLMWSQGQATPYLPMKVEWLWLTKEVSKDPGAWWEIRFME